MTVPEDIKAKALASSKFKFLKEETVGKDVTMHFVSVDNVPNYIELADKVRDLFPKETGIISSDSAVTMECNEKLGGGDQPVSERSIHVQFLL